MAAANHDGLDPEVEAFSRSFTGLIDRLPAPSSGAPYTTLPARLGDVHAKLAESEQSHGWRFALDTGWYDLEKR